MDKKPKKTKYWSYTMIITINANNGEDYYERVDVCEQKHKTKQRRRRFSSNTCIPLKIKFVDFSLISFALERSNIIVVGSALGLVFVLISPR